MINAPTSAGSTLILQAYDTDGTTYTTFATLTSNTTPTMDLAGSVTQAGAVIYRVGGTDVAVTDGGTGLSTLTANNVILGNGASAPQFVAPGSSGNVLLSNGTTWVSGTQTSGKAIVSATTYATYATLTGNIPQDNTIPQNGEGTQIMSITYVPVNASSQLIINWQVFGATASGNQLLTTALFQDSGASALMTAYTDCPNGNGPPVEVCGTYETSAASTTSRTYNIRIGAASGNTFPNGDGSSRLFGGTSVCNMQVIEITP